MSIVHIRRAELNGARTARPEREAVDAALELLESIEGETPFTAEAAREGACMTPSNGASSPSH